MKPGLLVSHRPLQGGLGRAFANLWAATAASNLSDGLVVVLLPLIAVGLTESPGAVAAVSVAGLAAWPLFGLFAGLAVDTFDRRRLAVTVTGFRDVALAGIAAAWSLGSVDLAVLYVAGLLLGVSETAADTALTSMVPMVVPPHQRGRGNARIETTMNLLNQLVGPPLAGVLVGVGVAVAAGTAARRSTASC